MAISQELLDILACPKCKGKVTLKPDQSGFVCAQCRLFFAVVDEIPNFLLEDARPLD
jgi:uncharacterized protein YbaR (Trm112 family)